MSSEEESNASQEEDNEEEEGSEVEENEEEGEENEDEEGEGEGESEGEENEDEEEENEDDDEDKDKEDDDKKKKKKGLKGKKADAKAENDKQKEQVEANKNNSLDNNNLFSLPNYPQRPQSILSILDEINHDMDSLTQELNTVFGRVNYTSSIPHSPPIPTHDVNKENEEIKKLIAQANSLCTEIDNNLIKHPESEDKCVGSDDENNNNNYQPTSEAYSPLYTTEPQPHKNNSSNSPYDWNRNIEYYNALNNRNKNRTAQYNNSNSNNPFIHQENYHTLNSTGSNHYQSSRVKKMDELYLNDGINKRPIIYSQDRNPVNNNYNSNNQPYKTEYASSNNNNYNEGNNNQQQQETRPFERYKPTSINQAMDILLDKQ